MQRNRQSDTLKLHNCSARTTRALVKEDDRLAEDEGEVVKGKYRIDASIHLINRETGEVKESINVADIEDRAEDIRRMVEELIDAGYEGD